MTARLVSGLGVGLVTATATAYLHDLHFAHRPGASGQRFELVSTAANIGGLGIGPLVSGILAQWVAENFELIDKYQPDILWFDNGVNGRNFDPLKMKVAAY